MLGHYRTLLRLAGILKILVRYDVEPLARLFFPFRMLTWIVGLWLPIRRMRRENSPQVRLRKAMEELGPTFIKFGQALSTQLDAMPEEYGVEMKKLQDEVPPFPFEKVVEIIKKDLGGPVEQFYIAFDPTPVASASIAQVHQARTLGGRKVAVKVMRPNVANVVEQDIRMLTTLAELVELYLPEWKRFRARKVVAEFASSIRNETNFQIEASRANRFQDNFKNDPEMFVPAVVWQLSTRHVLTMGWIDGIPIDELTKQDRNSIINPVEVSKNILTSFFKQVFRDGFFHADQHPGNIFVLPNGTITILDFGIIGRVSMQNRMWLAQLLQGFLQRNYRLVAEVHVEAGYVPRHTDLDAFEEACQMIAEPIFDQPLKDISIANLLAQLFKVTEQFNMPVQPHLLLLQKTLLVLEGVGREINPNLNIWQLSEPLIRQWMGEHLGPKGKIRKSTNQLKKFYDTSGLLPDLVQGGIETLIQDQFQLRIHKASVEGLERSINNGFRRQTAAITGGTLFMGGTLLALGGFSAWWYLPPIGFAMIHYFRGMGRSMH